MKTALDALNEKLRLLQCLNRKIDWLTTRGFVFEGRREVTSWTCDRKPDKEENDLMVELFLFHGFGGFAVVTR